MTQQEKLNPQVHKGDLIEVSGNDFLGIKPYRARVISARSPISLFVEALPEGQHEKVSRWNRQHVIYRDLVRYKKL